MGFFDHSIFSRSHLVVYLFGIPLVRTALFVVAWVCQIALALALFGLV